MKREETLMEEKKKEKVSFDEYQKHAYNLISEDGKKDLVLNGVLGLAGEAGECCDIVKKVKFQGHTMDKEHLMEEIGDVLWYVAETASGLGVSLSDVAQYNLDKLHNRYHGEKFNKEDSIHRTK
jgi:NTP pyrophosphatase (non-canonical NTP hydrolase)